MPPAISSPPQTKPWWSRSKSSKDSLRPNRSLSTLADDDDKYPSTAPSTSSSKNKDAPTIPLKFNTLASAIGLKSKKLPALTIQDPPSSLASVHRPHPYPKSRPGSGNSSVDSPPPAERTPYYTNRPPAQSVSTVRSLDYDYDAASELQSEPRTPSDHPRDRFSYQHSIMTFSEMDPFASGGIVVQHLPQDPNRLSVYSDSSMVDPQQKCADAPPTNRGSYGSSSSNSHGNSSDAQAQSPLSANSVARSPPASHSAYDLSQTRDSYYAEGSSGTSSQAHRTRMKTPSGSNSSNSTITQHDFRSRLSEPPAGNPAHLIRKRSTPALVRPRGMTVAAIDHRPSTANVTLTAAAVLPLQPHRQGTSPSESPNTPSPSPVVFSRSRTPSTTSTRIDSPITPNSPRPTVVVRKASASRLPVAPAPPTSNLPPPPPLPSLSPYDRSPIEFRASSSSSSLDFAPSIDYHDIDTGDAISHLMNDSYDYGPFESPRGSSKGKHRSNRNTYVVDGDLSPSADNDSALPSPLSKFPPVPSLIHGEIHSKAGKLLKKMSSQQNLLQRHSATSTTSSASWLPEEPNGSGSSQASSTPGKTPRKQRSFHASRVPLPPMPNLRGSSSNGNSSEVFPQPSSPIVEPRRSSVTSPRKRLFSGSSARRSTSSHGPTSAGAEDDKRSILSFDSDIRPVTSSGIESITMSFNSAGGSLSLLTRNACISPSSLWEDTNTGGGDNKRASQSEYTPQYIMAPADQLKLAEELAVEETTTSERDAGSGAESDRVPRLDLQPGDFGLTYSVAPNALRSRSNSVLSNQSTGTLAFGNDKPTFTRGTSLMSTKSSASSSNGRPTTATAAPTTSTDAIRSPARSSSMLARAPHKPPVLSARPSTAQASLTPPTSPGFMQTSHIDAPSSGLPPPPRRRPSRHDLQEHQTGKRASFVPMNPLSPPPPTRSAWNRRTESSDTTSSTISRPPSSFDRQKVAKRKSLMKKPSFLDIEDEPDATAGNGSDDEYGDEASTPEDPTMESSFLDMDHGKNSFDTVRSTDSAFFV